MGILVASGVSLHAGAAGAWNPWVDGVPNGRFEGTDRCGYCHTDGDGTAGGDEKTPFGQIYFAQGYDIASAVDIVAQWPNVYNGDADADGLTNGLELGDPNGGFPGTPPATTGITNPGIPEPGTSGDPGASEGAGPAKPPPPIQPGICAVAAPGTAGSGGGWAWIALGAAALLGLRRRRG